MCRRRRTWAPGRSERRRPLVDAGRRSLRARRDDVRRDRTTCRDGRAASAPGTARRLGAGAARREHQSRGGHGVTHPARAPRGRRGSRLRRRELRGFGQRRGGRWALQRLGLALDAPAAGSARRAAARRYRGHDARRPGPRVALRDVHGLGRRPARRRRDARRRPGRRALRRRGADAPVVQRRPGPRADRRGRLRRRHLRPFGAGSRRGRRGRGDRQSRRGRRIDGRPGPGPHSIAAPASHRAVARRRREHRLRSHEPARHGAVGPVARRRRACPAAARRRLRRQRPRQRDADPGPARRGRQRGAPVRVAIAVAAGGARDGRSRARHRHRAAPDARSERPGRAGRLRRGRPAVHRDGLRLGRRGSARPAGRRDTRVVRRSRHLPARLPSRAPLGRRRRAAPAARRGRHPRRRRGPPRGARLADPRAPRERAAAVRLAQGCERAVRPRHRAHLVRRRHGARLGEGGGERPVVARLRYGPLPALRDHRDPDGAVSRERSGRTAGS